MELIHLSLHPLFAEKVLKNDVKKYLIIFQKRFGK